MLIQISVIFLVKLFNMVFVAGGGVFTNYEVQGNMYVSQ